MDLHKELERFRREHDEILRFLGKFEGALTLAGAAADENRCQGLAQLREMEKKLAEIREHCSEEEKSVESPFQIYLDDFAFEYLQREHQLLEQLRNDFCAELKIVTTPPPTQELVRLGRQLLEQLRRHIAREEGLLKQIGDGTEAEEKVYLRYTHYGE